MMFLIYGRLLVTLEIMTISSGSVSHVESKNMCNMSLCLDLTEL